MVKKMCWGCCKRLDVERLNFYPVPPASAAKYAGKYFAVCDACAPAFSRFGAPVRRAA